MADYSKLSDEALQQISSGNVDYSKLSDGDLEAISLGTKPVGDDPENEYVGMAKAAGQGALQGASFGFADELEAAARSAFGEKTYDETIKEVRDRYKKYEEKNPGVSLVSNIAGGFLVPGMGLARAAKGASALSAVGRGAAAGALTAAGNTEEDLLSEEGVSDVAKGAIGGGVMSGAGAAIGKGLSKASNVLGIKATGATFSEAKHFKPDTIKVMRDKKIVPWLGTAEDVARNAEEVLDESGKAIGAKLRGLNKQGVIVTREEVENYLNRGVTRLSTRAGDHSAKAQAETQGKRILDLMGDNDSVPITWLQKQKVSVAPKANAWLNPDAAKGDKTVYKGLANLIENKAKEASPEILSSLKEEQKIYGAVAPVFRAAANKAIKNKSQVAAGLLDLGVGGAVAADDFRRGNYATGIAKGVGAAAARHAIAPRVSGFLFNATHAGRNVPEYLSRTKHVIDLGSGLLDKSKQEENR